MKAMIGLLLALMLALPLTSSGEGAATAADRFIARAGIEADAALREEIETFIDEQGYTPAMLDNMDPARLACYAEHLAQDLPISYAELLDAPSAPLPDGTEIKQLAVLIPQGAATESLLVDFKRQRVYYDENFPVPRDVCRAAHAGPLSDADGEELYKLLADASFDDAPVEPSGVELGAPQLAVGWDGGVARCSAGASQDFMNTVRALIDAGRRAAQGEHP